MSIASRVRDYLTGADLAPRALSDPPERRDALGALPVLWQQGRATWPEHTVLNAHAHGYAISATIYACVTLRARCLSAATVRVYDGHDAQKEPNDRHRLRRLMERPNRFMSEAEFFSLVSTIADVTNFCVIEKERSAAGNVVGLHPLRSDWLKPILRPNAAPDWEYRIPGYSEPFTLLARDAIVYTVGTNPLMPATGFGPMNVIFREASIDRAMTDYLKAFFDNGGAPLLGLIPNPDANLSPAEGATLKELYRQVLRTGDPLIMQSITDIKRLGFDFDELAYPELRRLTEQHVCSAWGVPPTLVGAAAADTAETNSNVANYLRQFYWNTIQPLWARLDGAFTRSLVPEFGDPDLSLEFDTSGIDALAEDMTEERLQARLAWQAGIFRRDEVRQVFGLEEIGGSEGEMFYPLGGGPPAEGADDGDRARHLLTITPPALPPHVNGTDDEFRDHVLGILDDCRADLDAEQDRWDRAWTAMRANGNGHHPERLAILPATVEYRAKVGDANKAEIERLAEAWGPRIAGFFAEQGERLLDAIPLRAAGVVIETRDIAAVDWDEEYRLLVEFLERFFVDAGEAAFAVAGDSLGVGVSFDLANPFIQSMMQRLGTRIVGISETTRQEVDATIRTALGEGADLPMIRDRIKTLTAETYRGRALTIARTESMVAYGAGSVEAYRATGQVSFCEVLDNASHTEPYGAADGLTCASRNGIVVPLDRAMFHVESDHPNGSAALLPLLSAPLGQE